MRVLLVDDEIEFLELMKVRLEQRGVDIETAATGDEGVRLAGSSHFDVAVLDVKMPGVDGIETLRQLKEVAPTLPVLFLSGHACPDSAIKSVERGAADYMLKPIALNDLLARLRDICGKKK